MLAGKDWKLSGSVDGPEVRLRPASDGVRYQLIDVAGNKTITSSSGALETSQHAPSIDANQSPTERPDQAPTKPREWMVSTTSSVTSVLRHTTANVNSSSHKTVAPDHEATAWKTKLRLETALASRTDSVSGDHVTTESTYDKNKQSSTIETLSGVLANVLRTNSSADNGSRKLSLYLAISSEIRLRGISQNRSLDFHASTTAATESRGQHVDQSASTTWAPEVNNTTASGVGNRTKVWNVGERSNSTERSTMTRVQYVHTLLAEDGDQARAWLSPVEMVSLSAASVFSLLVLVAVLLFIVYRRRCTGSRRPKVVCNDGWKAGATAGDDKLRVLRRVADETETLSPDLLDQIIRAELARGRAKRYRARLRDGDDREQLQRLAIELSDDWGTPPPSYRRLAPVNGGHTHRRWVTDSPARVHDLPPSLPDLPPPPPPPVPARLFTSRPTAVPLDFRQFRRPLPEIPRQNDSTEMTSCCSETPGMSTDMETIRSPQRDVISPSPRTNNNVIRSPLPVAVTAQDGGAGSDRNKRRSTIARSCNVTTTFPHDVIGFSRQFFGCRAQDGGAGSSEVRRRFPKMGRSCLLESLRQRGDSLDAGSVTPRVIRPHFQASLSAEDAARPTSSGCCACVSNVHHSAVTSWTRDLSHLPVLLRDTTV